MFTLTFPIERIYCLHFLSGHIILLGWWACGTPQAWERPISSNISSFPPFFAKKITSFFLARQPSMTVQCKLGSADSSLAETPFLKDTFQKILATIFWFLIHKSTQNSGKSRFSGKSWVNDFSVKSSFHYNFILFCVSWHNLSSRLKLTIISGFFFNTGRRKN